MTSENKHGWLPITMIGALFFIFGFVTWLNSILIPYFKMSCELSDFASTLVAFAFYISYTVMALPSSWLLGRVGFHRGMSVGLWVMAVGAAMFIPAAAWRAYPVFLSGLFVMGAGLALLQTAANPYVTILGPEESAARRISIMGICNKLAGVAAPLVLAFFLLKETDVAGLDQLQGDARVAALDALARRAMLPYGLMTAVLALLGLFVRYAPFPDIEQEEEAAGADDPAPRREKSSALQHPQLVLGVVALFFYVGAEVIAGDTIIRYGQSLGFSMDTAKLFTSCTLGCMIVGYLAGIALIPKHMSQVWALRLSAILGLALTAGAVALPGAASVACLAGLGLANALVWPSIWPLALHGVGRFIKTGSALLVMACSGGALIPLAWGGLSDVWGSQPAYLVLVPLYLFILYYAFAGYRKRDWGKSE